MTEEDASESLELIKNSITDEGKVLITSFVEENVHDWSENP